MWLSDFRSQIARGRDGERGSVRVRITGKTAGMKPWTTVGSAPDLLHASWLALADCLEYAVLTRAGVSSAVEARLHATAIPLTELAALLRPELGDPDRAVLRALEETDWTQTTLDLGEPADRELAAHATALGAAVFYSFGNFCAIAAHPDKRSVVRVNLVKGRPENQVGSVTTTRDRFDTLFDWSLLPDGLSREQVLALIDDFYELGPMGFRGPAAPGIPDHVTSLDGETRTTQQIGPGYRCPSNELLDDVLARAGVDYLFITSANVSSGVTGRVEAAHYDLRGMQEDFGESDGIVLIGHRDEAAARASYPRHLPMSTSILAFHKLARDESGQRGADSRAAWVARRGRRERARRQARLRPRPRRRRPRAATDARRCDGRLVEGRSGWGDRDGRPALGDQRREDRAELGAVPERRAGEHESLQSLANAVAGIRWLEAGLWMRDAGERTLGFVEALRVGHETPGLAA